MYELILTPKARRDLQRLDAKIQRQVLRKLERLRENCDEYDHKALKGRYKGKFKLPSGTTELSILIINKLRLLKSPEFNIVRLSMNKVNIPLTPENKKNASTPQRIPRTHP